VALTKRAIFRSLGPAHPAVHYAQKSRHVMPVQYGSTRFPPPTPRRRRRPGGFLRWALKGSGAALVWAGVLSMLALALSRSGAHWFRGWCLTRTCGERGVCDQPGLPVGTGVFLLLRRRCLASVICQSIVRDPMCFRSSCYHGASLPLGQAVTFFDNDFAGRFPQKEMQSSLR